MNEISLCELMIAGVDLAGPCACRTNIIEMINIFVTVYIITLLRL